MDAYQPQSSDRFTFGLWTVGNPGRDPFGLPVRPVMEPTYLVRRLSECGAYGVNLHDEDLIPFGSPAGDRDRIVAQFKAALDDHGMVVPMATTNLFSQPIFKDGAFTASDPTVRAFALQKTMAAIDLGVELGARIFVCWGGREGTEADACRDVRDAIAWHRECMNFLCGYVRDQGYELRFALEPKPNEPRGDLYLPTVGHMLAFIETLDHPELVGVNPEVAHETMSGLSFVHAVGQAMERDKLFHIDLNAQRIGRYDQDLRFGSEDLKQAFLLVRLLEGTHGYPAYTGPLHFDAHAYRTESDEGVWDFAVGCMRTYKILAQRARVFDADPEVREILAGAGASPPLQRLMGSYSPDHRRELQAWAVDVDEVARRGLGYERLDQLLVEHLMGVRG
jgi:xylose isomerase